MSEHGHTSYIKVLVWLAVLTVAEIGWALVFAHSNRFILISGLSAMAAVKAALVGLYYMHLKYEGKILWAAILFPLLLVVVMIAGFLPDALAPIGV